MEMEITETEVKTKSAKALLWLGIISIVMVFAGLTSAYIIREAKGEWLLFELPLNFYISTGVIVFASVSIIMAVSAAKKNNYSGIVSFAGITLLLGIAFIFSQALGWKSMTESGIFFTGPGSNVSASFLYVITALHVAHVTGGIVALCIVLMNSLKKKYDSVNHNGLQLCATYWHFLGALWIYLLIFLLYVH